MEWLTEDRDGERLPGWQSSGFTLYRLDAAGVRNHDSLLVGQASGEMNVNILKETLAERIAHVLNGMEVFMLGEKQDYAWVVHCTTGCSCCRSDNFYMGPFKSKGEAEDRVLRNKKDCVLSSQYSHTGNYYIEKVDLIEIGPILILDGWYATKEWESFRMDHYREGT